ncbi:MAG: hypothetical protein D4S01_03210 [Dehalococcoidia bacterium]|nr:MAG: hypothetical protein D4S01_03210 [Dehalococcoidia bacterium]
MKIFSVLMACLLISIFNILPLSYAEIIFTKDGQVINASITEKSDNTIWYEVESADMIEEIGIDISAVDNVLNDDGSISEYSPRYAS